MLTRLQVKGFKNLVDVDIHFGPFTCIAGPNGVGKSNLFDAIRFLSELADKPFVEAARSIRGGEELSSLFTYRHEQRMEFIVDMLIPKRGFDDFGQPAETNTTYLRYELTLALEDSKNSAGSPRIRLEHELLKYLTKADAKSELQTRYSDAWINSVISSSPRRTTFITPEQSAARGAVIRLQSDRMRAEEKEKRGGGKAVGFSARSLPRTVLSSAQNAEETRTAVLVREEMRNWRQIQLEPSALRKTDDFDSPDRIDASGAHIPAALWRLASSKNIKKTERVYSAIANSLSTLVEKVGSIRVDRDEVRRALRFMMEDEDGLELSGSSLSDGTMRFVALAIIEQDTKEIGVMCLEEPENGIHPQRIDAMLDLLYGIAVDPIRSVGLDNPLRQIIVSTHSPILAARVHRDDCVFAKVRHHGLGKSRISGLELLGLVGSWREKLTKRSISDGDAIAYLKGIGMVESPVPFRDSVAGQFWKQLPLPLVLKDGSQ